MKICNKCKNCLVTPQAISDTICDGCYFKKQNREGRQSEAFVPIYGDEEPTIKYVRRSRR